MQEDVYETVDLPESDQDKTKEEAFESEHVEKTKLDINSAYQAFKGKSLETDTVDFSDSVGRRRRGYGAGAFVIELVQPLSGEPETVTQQYARLQNEIRELSEKLQEAKQKLSSDNAAERVIDNVTAADVTELQQNLKRLQVEQILGQQATNDLADPHNAVLNKVIEAMEKSKQIAPGKQQAPSKEQKTAANQSGGVTYELYCHPDRSVNADLTKLAEVESRLAALEQLLGNDTEKLAALTTDAKGKSITDAIEALAQRLQLVDLNHLELIEARLTVLSQKLTQVKEKRTALDGEDSARVNEIYDILKKWDNLCTSLPQIVARMQSLKDLHEQCLQFSQSLTFLDGAQQELTKSLDSDVSLLNEMKETFAKNLETFKSNCDNIDKRLKNLSK